MRPVPHGLNDTPRDDDPRAIVGPAPERNTHSPGTAGPLSGGELKLAISGNCADGNIRPESSAERHVNAARETRGLSVSKIEMIDTPETFEILLVWLWVLWTALLKHSAAH